MRLFSIALIVVCIVGFLMAACSKPSQEVIELKRFPLDTMEGIITRSGVEIDTKTYCGGSGSLKASTTEPTTILLFELDDVDVEDARLIYVARVRTENVEGQVYLEMWCHFPGKGEFFSRGIQTPLKGTTEWTTVETPFMLQKGQNPDRVKLNLVIDGKGTAWIDDVRLIQGPLQ